MAPKFGYAPDVEARFARTNLEMTQGGLSYQRLQPNVRFPFAHTHSEQEEVYVVLSGGGRMKIDDDIIDLEKWDTVRVGPGAIRGVRERAGGRRGTGVRSAEHRQQGRRDAAGVVDGLTVRRRVPAGG